MNCNNFSEKLAHCLLDPYTRTWIHTKTSCKFVYFQILWLDVNPTQQPQGEGANGNELDSAKTSGMLEFVHTPVDRLDLQVGDLVEQECRVNNEAAVVTWYKDDENLPVGKAHWK